MATYTKVYNNPYPDGWKDGKDGNTPVTADILNNQTETLEAIEQYLEDNPIEQGGGSGTGGTKNYEELENRPKINGVELVGDLSAEDLGLTGGGETGTTNYEDLTNKPSINGTELSGDITLDIPTKTSDLTNDSGFLTDIKGKSYNDLAEKPQINGIDLQGNLNVEELGLLDITESTDTTLENSKDGVLKIKEIYGNTKQDTTSGKNLLDCSGLSATTTNGITFTPVYDENGLLEYINVNGTNDSAETSVLAIPITLNASTDYILNGCPSGGSASKYRLYIANTTDSTAGIDYGSGATFNTGEVTSWTVRLRIESGVTVSNLKFYPMIRLATITDGTYEPFTNGASPNPSYPQEIKSVVLSEIKTCKKNLLNPATAIDNKFLNSPIYDYVITDNAEHWISDFIEVKEGQVISTNYPPVAITIYDSNKKGFKYYYSHEQTITIPSGGKYAVFCYRKTMVEFGADVIICVGTDTEYEPYTESVATLSNPITLNGLNGVQDYADAKRVVLVQKWKEVVLDGSENWSSISLANGLFRTDVHNLQNAFGTDKYQPIICSHYPVIFSAEKVCCFLSKTEEKISFISNHVSTLDEWKEWLSSNNVTVVYELAEPIETPLTDADVEALKSLKTYDGVTHIFTDSEIEPDWFVEYNTTRVGTELDEIDAELAKINKRITDIGTTAQMNYSTEEQVVGTWIDGKPLYQRTVDCGSLPSVANATVEIPHNIENIQQIVEYKIYGISENTTIPLPYLGTGSDSINCYVNLTYIIISTKIDRSMYNAYATVQYTKTTDTV